MRISDADLADLGAGLQDVDAVGEGAEVVAGAAGLQQGAAEVVKVGFRITRSLPEPSPWPLRRPPPGSRPESQVVPVSGTRCDGCLCRRRMPRLR